MAVPFRNRFSTKLILLIGLVFFIPVVTSLATVVFTSKASVERLDEVLARAPSEQNGLIRSLFPKDTFEGVENPAAAVRLLRDYEKRRTFGLFVSLIIIACVLAAIIVLLSMLLLKRGMLSLHQLSLAADEVGEGNYDVTLIRHSRDEFAELIGAFTAMKLKLKETTVSRDFYNHVLESVPAAVFTLDQDDIVTTWNRRTEELTGLSASETVGRKVELFSDVIGPSVAASDIPHFGRESHVHTRDGIERTVTRGVDFLYGRKGAITGRIETFVDISAQKRLERELIVARDEAFEASRLRSEFLANMSHEIRTPLNGIMGLADTLQDDEHDEDRRASLEAIIQCGKNLLHMINEILELAKLEAGKMIVQTAVVSPESIVREAMATIEVAARRKGLELTVDIDPDVPPMVEVDHHKLSRILINLFGNALKFTEAGSIHVQVRQTPDERAGNLLFAVIDTGVGIPKDRQSRIFESFVQADEYLTRGDGTGLGLAIVVKLAHLMGGEVWMESEPEKGSSFFFTIASAEVPQDLDRR